MDDRGRVPFALVGVVLLVTATALGATLATRDTPAETNAADRAADRALTGARVALERATIEASAAAAANPVVAPADTPYGRVLRDDSAFRDALALRVYAAARAAFDDLDASHGAASARVSLDPLDTPRDARRAIRAVEFDELLPNRVRVTVRNATLAVTDHGESVGVRERAVSVVVDTPVLALHDRMASFAARLDRGVLRGYGLAREATLRLAPYTAARGLAQYAGAPIANVLANRHVEVAANDGLLAVQRATFGRASNASSDAVGRAYALTGVTDALAVTRASARERATRILDAVNVTPARPPPDPAASSSLTPAAAADTALLDALDGGLADALADAYRLDARRLVRVTRTDRRLDAATPPANWTRLATDTTTETTVASAPAASPGSFDVPGGFRALDSVSRRVTVTRTTRSSWTNGSAVRTLTDVERSAYRVSVALAARPAALDGVPTRPVDALSQRATDAVRRSLLPGGADALAARAATDDAGTRSATVRVSPPAALVERAARSLGRTRDRVANTSTTTRVSGAGVLASSPVAALADTLAADRDRLVAAPARYGSLAERALTAARARYLDSTLAAVRERADDAAGVRGALRDTVSRLGGWIPTGATTRETPETVVSDVDASPRYLSLVDAEALAARNVNVFTLPYGDAADAVADAAFDGGARAVRLATAADLLAVAGARTPDLGAAVRAETARVRERFAAALADRTGLDSDSAERVVSNAAARWRTDAARARAATNGSLAAAVVADSGSRGTERVALAAALRAESRALSRDGGGVDEDVVRAARERVRGELTDALGRASTERARRALGGRLAALPAGLPVVPLPGFWYATVNAWTVSVRGGYDRVAISGGALPPGFDAGAYEYVRENAAVSLDVDGDGRPDPLGRNTRVAFAFDTVVVAAVPPGPRGVGDTDGNADERSPGW
ncbi:DUF7286 family protein [Salarchaeum japonicum]|uniref:DUF4012 domain-containing protein n=1 Tax=Salarchaeum japonicum TaxID=555573 RepID=A0AAV3T1P8_9EURY|nr:hypothetical protein [Salarchaeum japonicum]